MKKNRKFTAALLVTLFSGVIPAHAQMTDGDGGVMNQLYGDTKAPAAYKKLPPEQRPKGDFYKTTPAEAWGTIPGTTRTCEVTYSGGKCTAKIKISEPKKEDRIITNDYPGKTPGDVFR